MRSEVCLAFRTMAATQARAIADGKKRDEEYARVEGAAQVAAQARAQALADAQEAERARIAALPPRKDYRFDPPAPRGAHHWTWHEGGEFGYQRALSEQDKQRGIAAAPLFVVGYQGKQSGVYNFATADSQLLSCRTPCETIMSLSAAAGRQVFPVVRGSLLWALVEDARNGWLSAGPVTTTDPNYKPEW